MMLGGGGGRKENPYNGNSFSKDFASSRSGKMPFEILFIFWIFSVDGVENRIGFDLVLEKTNGNMPSEITKLLSSYFSLLPKVNRTDLKICYFVYNDNIHDINMEPVNRIPTLHTVFSDVEKFDSSLDRSGTVMFINTPFEETLSIVRDVRFSNYVIFEKCENLEIVFQKFLTRRIINVLGVCVEDSTIHLYTFNPYSKLGCLKTDKILIATWKSNDSPPLKNYLFMKWEKIENLYGCTVNISLHHSPQAVVWENEELRGWDVFMLRETLQKLNGMAKFHVIPQDMISSVEIRDFLKETSEIVGGMLLNAPPNSGETQILTGLTVSMSWVVPKTEDNNIIKSNTGFIVFSQSAWLLIAVAYLIAVGFTFCLLKRDEKYLEGNMIAFRHALRIYWVLVGHPVKLPKLNNALKCFFINWCFVAFFFNTLYQADLRRGMATRAKTLEFLDLNDIVRSDLKVVCSLNNYLYYLKNLIDFDPELEQLKSRIEILPVDAKVENVLRRLARDKNFVYLEKQERLDAVIQDIDLEFLDHVRIQEKTIERLPSAVFLVKQSPLLEPLREMFFYLAESGVSKKVKKNYLFKNERLISLLKAQHEVVIGYALSIRDIADANFIILTGHGISIYILMLENYIYCYRSKKTKERLIAMFFMFVAGSGVLVFSIYGYVKGCFIWNRK